MPLRKRWECHTIRSLFQVEEVKEHPVSPEDFWNPTRYNAGWKAHRPGTKQEHTVRPLCYNEREIVFSLRAYL